MIFNLYRISYHPEYINLRLEHIDYVDGYENNIHDIVQAEEYFQNKLLRYNQRIITKENNSSYDPNSSENEDAGTDLGYIITSNVDTIAETYNLDKTNF